MNEKSESGNFARGSSCVELIEADRPYLKLPLDNLYRRNIPAPVVKA
jgi:hypothetical protein